MTRLIPVLLASLAFASLGSPASAAPPGATELNGQKVLTLVVRGPPALRCNNNMQVAAELANLYKVTVLVVPASLAPASKAPAVYWGDQRIAEDGGDFNGMVGFAQLRWGGAPGCVVAVAPGEVQRLYVARDYHGKGVAHDLMNACLDEMTSHRSDVAWLGVWERNPRAIAFYRKFGFVEVGEHVFLLGRDRQRDIVLARPVRRS